jgi:F-type H+-transporting ATPase subunit O
MANFSFINAQQRFFAKKSKKGGKTDAGASSEQEVEEAATHMAHAAPTRATKFDWTAQANKDSLDAPKLDAEFYKPFTVGENIKRVASAPDHRPPSFEDTIEGRYAASLFISASQNGKLFEVYEDVVYLNHLYKNCEHFRLFTENNGIGLSDVHKLNAALRETADFDEVTFKFLVVLAEAKRLIYLREISEKYAKLYMQLNKEEKITIISASDLNDSQKSQVLAALKANPKNEGKQFVIQYKVDALIQGGLQMYTESEFIDMSLVSRRNMINNEIAKLVN